MMNFVSERYGELAPWYGPLLRLVRWIQTLRLERKETVVHTRESYKPARRIDTDTQLLLTLARQQMTNLTK